MSPTLVEAFTPAQDCVMRFRRYGGGYICELPKRRRPWRCRSLAEIVRLARAWGASEVSATYQLGPVPVGYIADAARRVPLDDQEDQLDAWDRRRRPPSVADQPLTKRQQTPRANARPHASTTQRGQSSRE